MTSNADAARSPGTQATYPICPMAQRMMTGTPLSTIPGSPKFTLLAVKAQIEISIRIGNSSTKDIAMFSFISHDLGPRCGGARFLRRALREQGHEVRLLAAQDVKPDVKTNKSDYIDAEAIAEKIGRPRMPFVPIKSDDQLDLQSALGTGALDDASHGGYQPNSWLAGPQMAPGRGEPFPSLVPELVFLRYSSIGLI